MTRTRLPQWTKRVCTALRPKIHHHPVHPQLPSKVSTRAKPPLSISAASNSFLYPSSSLYYSFPVPVEEPEGSKCRASSRPLRSVSVHACTLVATITWIYLCTACADVCTGAAVAVVARIRAFR